MVKGEEIYYKIIDEFDIEYRYYIIKTENGEYYVKSEVLRFYNITATLQGVSDHKIHCLKIESDEVEKIIRLLEKGINVFEEEYRNKDWIDC
jgi:hypothetical protein